MDPLLPHAGFYSDGDAHVDPRRAVEFICQRRGVTPDQLGVNRVVIGTFVPRLTEFIASQSDARPPEHWLRGSGDAAFVTPDGITIATLPVGAPAAVILVEEMIACGMRVLIVTGSAGSLQPGVSIGSIVVPTAAIREEGTSHHYAPSDAPAVASNRAVDTVVQVLGERNVAHFAGLQWTTDAIYREHREKIDRYRAAGVLAVDMELSALYTVAAYRDVECGAVLAISDELHGDSWGIGFSDARFVQAMDEAALIALEVARRM
jgi:uridine phosphorylase